MIGTRAFRCYSRAAGNRCCSKQPNQQAACHSINSLSHYVMKHSRSRISCASCVFRAASVSFASVVFPVCDPANTPTNPSRSARCRSVSRAAVRSTCNSRASASICLHFHSAPCSDVCPGARPLQTPCSWPKPSSQTTRATASCRAPSLSSRQPFALGKGNNANSAPASEMGQDCALSTQESVAISSVKYSYGFEATGK